MKRVEEVLTKMERANSWKEVGISVAEMMEILKDIVENGETNSVDDAEKRRLRNKVDRLTESNKKLMEENKKLKGVK